MNNRRKSVVRNIVVLFLNIILIFSLVYSFIVFDRGYKKKLYNQNVDEISNINQSSANISASFFSSRESKIRDVALFIEEKQLTLEESLDFIYNTNSDTAKTFELIDENYKGYRVEKNEDNIYPDVNYSRGYEKTVKFFQSNMKEDNSQITNFLCEFTDAYTGKESFAVYNCVHIKDESGKLVPYTLMVVSTTADFADRINIESGYEKLSSAIINKSGNYIIGNSEFKSNNFFAFLEVFNDLSLDQKEKIKDVVHKEKKGSLAYKDGRGRESVFVYTPVEYKDWYCVTVVPVKYFRNGESEFVYTPVIVAIMLLLLAVDISYLCSLNRKLKISARNESVASAAKADFLARMSHDMRTPMNGIIGMTRLTQSIENLPEEVAQGLDAISNSSEYLLQLINDTLDMNKIESNKLKLSPDVMNVKDFSNHMVTDVRMLISQKKIRFEYIPIDEDVEYIYADRTRLQQILMNIISNAIKFTPVSGVIRTEVKCIKQERGRVFIRISVEDSGCGMDEEFLKHIYEPFTQEDTKRVKEQEGSGLGMAIVKNLVELMGGRIEINSELGVGTKVTIFVDFKSVYDVKKKTPDFKKINIAELKNKRILLAEDHPLNTKIAAKLLEKEGMLVECAGNGAIAVQMFERSPVGYYDAILMDIRMPVMNGLDAAKNIREFEREDAKGIPIIAVTANTYAEDGEAILQAGMNAHLTKPFEPEVLYSELKRYIH